MREHAYYNSLLVILQIKSSHNTITELSFVNKLKINEDVGVIAEPVCAIIKTCIALQDKYFAGNSFEFDVTRTQPGTGFRQRV